MQESTDNTATSNSASPPPHTPKEKRQWLIRLGVAASVATIAGVGADLLKPNGSAVNVTSHGQRGGITAGNNSVNVISYGQRGGVTAGTVNIAPVQRTLSGPSGDALKAEMLTKLSRATPIEVMASMEAGDSYNFAYEIYEFLKANGFTMAKGGPGRELTKFPAWGVQMNWNEKDNTVTILIGSAN